MGFTWKNMKKIQKDIPNHPKMPVYPTSCASRKNYHLYSASWRPLASCCLKTCAAPAAPQPHNARKIQMLRKAWLFTNMLVGGCFTTNNPSEKKTAQVVKLDHHQPLGVRVEAKLRWSKAFWSSPLPRGTRKREPASRWGEFDKKR